MNSSAQDYAQVLKELDVAAGAMGIKLQHLGIERGADFDSVFRPLPRGALKPLSYG